MCQCGCGDTGIEKAFALTRGCIMGYQLYRGCRDCFPGPGVSLLFFNRKDSEWLRGVKIEESIKPDEHGGNKGSGFAVGLFEVQDLQEEARELWKEARIGRGRDDYRNLDDWLADYGFQMVQGALDRFRKRMDEEEKRRNREIPA